MKSIEDWEPIPQRKPPKMDQDELQVELPPVEPMPEYKKQSPEYEIGEGVNITPPDHSGTIDDEEEE